jgi:phage terminase large subunit GpA-like protein
MSAIKVQENGAKYCHFPRGEEHGYDSNYFNGLLSEKLVLSHTKRGNKWTWEKLPGTLHILKTPTVL